MAKKKTSGPEGISIPKPDIRVLKVKIIGEAPIVMHRFAEKAIKQIEDKQAKKAKQARPKRDPKAEYESSMYKVGKKYAFPANAFKQAMKSACRQLDGGITMAKASGAFFVLGDISTEMIEIHGKPQMRTDTVRVPPRTGGADLRYRAEFPEWWARINIKYNANVISAEQILNLLFTAGFAVGVGEWRPDRGGTFGTFVPEGIK